jgi:hypothetical protein
MQQPPVWGLPGAFVSRTRVARKVALALALAAGCRGGDGPTDGSPVKGVLLTVSQPQILVGTTTQVTAKLVDAEGNEVRDRVPFFASLTPAVVGVSATGEVTGLQPGSGQVRASSGSISSIATIIVRNPVATSIQLSRDSATLAMPGGTFQLIAAVTDELGRSIANPPIVWTSLNPLVATVNVAGLVTAVASGSTSITGTIDGLTTKMVVLVRPIAANGAPTVSAITPAVLRPGGTHVITGANFATQPAANQVLVEGVAATVQSASATQLTIVLPATGFGCEPTRDAFVQVSAAALTGGSLAPLQTANRRALAVGQSVIVADLEEVRCNELVPGTGRWAVSVYNASRAAVTPTSSGTVQFQIRGVPGATIAATSAAAPSSSSRIEPAMPQGEREAAESPHVALLEQNIAALRGASRPRGPAGPKSGANLTVANQVTTLGNITAVRIPNLDGADICVANFPVNARTVYVSQHAVILEDTTGVFNGKTTLRGQMDDYFARLGAEFESVMWPIIESSFGSPLAMDGQLSNIGRVVMVFSPRVNTMRGGAVSGFVASCDFLPVGTRPSSNGGAFFYATVPTSSASGYFVAETRDQWLRIIRSTVIHEVKHLAGFAERLSRNVPVEDASWEEGSARVAEEIYARSIYGAGGPLANTIYAPTIGCDLKFALGTAPCADRPILMYRHFDALYSYMTAPEVYSPLGRSLNTDLNFYAGAWSLLRWAADHSGIPESQFFRDFTTSPSAGVLNVEARTGRRWEESLGEWSLAAYLDEAGGFSPANTRLRMRSWNYADMWLGLCGDFGPCLNPLNPVQLYPRSTPFSPRHREFGAFQFGVGAMIGGGFTILDLDGPGFASQVIEVKSALTSGDAPPSVRVAFVRVR